MYLDFLQKFEFFAGVPDSQLKELCNYLMYRFGINENHVIAANEGCCVAMAAGYHLATGKVPVVYMQNSGIGNIINPVASLMNDKVYGIPCIFFVGWRGEPGIHDEPQHIYQGEVTLKLLEDMDIKTFVIGKQTTAEDVEKQLEEWQPLLDTGKQVAFVVQKGSLQFDNKVKYQNQQTMSREEIIRHIVAVSGTDPIISTTGKASRELFEIREANSQGHQYDFLTVGSMGHASSIALEVAIQKKSKKIWCIDGDGAALMHMGAMALIGSNSPKNMVHAVINNEAHETVGGMPTAASRIDMVAVAKACGYPNAVRVSDFDALDRVLLDAKAKNELYFIEIMCSIGARSDLGRPTTTAGENKVKFMEYIAK